MIIIWIQYKKKKKQKIKRNNNFDLFVINKFNDL